MIFNVCRHWTHTDTRNSKPGFVSFFLRACLLVLSSTIISVSTVSALCVCRYVERKHFLERVDHRQFELEKSVRMNNMKRWQEEKADTFSDQNTDCAIFTHTLHTLCFLCHIGGITCTPPKQKLVCFHNLNVQLPYLFSLRPLFLCPILHVYVYQGFFNMKEE